MPHPEVMDFELETKTKLDFWIASCEISMSIFYIKEEE